MLMVRLIALLLTMTLAGPAWAGSAEQARRQVAFARAELADGNFAGALRSAESALRLVPDVHEATLVKALAYEGLDEFELAEALLLGYLEEVPSVEQDPEAQGTLVRISEQFSRRRMRGPRPPPTRGDAGAEVDIEPYRRRITSALEQGRPKAAWSAAQELTRVAPESAEGWRFAGSAANSVGRTLDAVRAYRRFQELGGDDIRVSQVMELLAAEFGALQIDLVGQMEGLTPQVTLRVDGHVLASPHDGARRVFYDLPPGESATLQIEGRGLASMTLGLTVPGRGQIERVEVPIESIGHGALVLGSWTEEELAVELHNEGGWHHVTPKERREVTAGPSVLRVSGRYGHVDVELEVPEGGEVAIEPVLYAPAQLTMVGLPAGAEIRVFVEGPKDLIIEQFRATPVRGASVDPSTGIPIAGPQGFRALAGGRVGVFVKHQKWGEGAVEVAIMAGEASSVVFDPATLPNKPDPSAVAQPAPKPERSKPARASRSVDRQAQTASAGVARGQPAPGGVIAGAVLLGLAGGSAGVATSQWHQSQTVALELYDGDHLGQDVSGWEIDGSRAQTVFRIGLGASIGLGVAGLVSLVATGATETRRRSRAVSALPWLGGDETTVVVGVGGRW